MSMYRDDDIVVRVTVYRDDESRSTTEDIGYAVGLASFERATLVAVEQWIHDAMIYRSEMTPSGFVQAVYNGEFNTD
jgi:hypothetical protein